ncbi:MAG: patatin-like phospholipase family protein [Rubritepida sp.]|nr:patatin-like phospholipase family protein [Rubritepida sp.]
MLGRRSALLSAAALSACATPQRGPAVPPEDALRAQVLGVPDERFVAGAMTEGFRRVFGEALARRRAVLGLRPNEPMPYFELLGISGGGEDGAFGAGVLTAWADRPQFNLVTGVSTGALTAPFAYLGPAWDDGLRRVYTGVRLADVAERRAWTALLFDDALLDTAPLFRLISRELDARMLDAIATEHRRGRLLLIGTTNLDNGTPVVWNIGAMAASGHPRAPEVIRKVLLASASIPGAFPPVLFDVEVRGRRHQELHVDGGAIAQVFLYPTALGEERVAAMRAGRRVPPIRAWVIRNGRLDAEWAETGRRTFSIAQRAVSTMLFSSGYHDAERLWLTAERDGIDFNLTWITPDANVTYTEPFDPVYMRALFDYGQARVRSGNAWHKRPPIGGA